MITRKVEAICKSWMPGLVNLVEICSPEPISDRQALACELEAFVKREHNIFIMQFNGQEEVIGFCGLTPHNGMVGELKSSDPELIFDDNMYYYEMIGIKTEFRNTTAFLRLLLHSVECAGSRGMYRFSCHIRTTNGVNDTIRKLFPDHRVFRAIPNWMGTGELFEYMEFTSHPENISRMRRLLRL